MFLTIQHYSNIKYTERSKKSIKNLNSGSSTAIFITQNSKHCIIYYIDCHYNQRPHKGHCRRIVYIEVNGYIYILNILCSQYARSSAENL